MQEDEKISAGLYFYYEASSSTTAAKKMTLLKVSGGFFPGNQHNYKQKSPEYTGLLGG